MSNVNNIKEVFNKATIDSFLVLSHPNIFYLTGYGGFSKEEREAVVLITRKNNYLITDGRYEEEVRGVKEFRVKISSPSKRLEQILLEIVKNEKIKATGFEENSMTVAELAKFKKVFRNLKPSSTYLRNLRSVKSPEEISRIKKACSLGDKTFKFILKKIKKGVSEQNLAIEIELFIRSLGAEPSFAPIVAFGKNAAAPHHVPTSKKLVKDRIVLLDFGVKYKGYCSDMTRTVFLGKPKGSVTKIYQTVLSAQKKSAERVKLSAKASAIDKTAREHFEKEGFPTIPHSLGHGIGVEVHEAPFLSPSSSEKLEEGMIFSIEPGIYLKNKLGIRIEDLYLLEKTGLRKITLSPSSIIVLK